MPVNGEVEKKPALRLRTSIGDGDLGGHKFNVTANIDGMAIFVEYKDKPVVVYRVAPMIEDAWQLVKDKPKPEWKLSQKGK